MKVKYRLFDYINICVILAMIFIMVYPIWYTIVGAFNDGNDYMRGGVYFWPRAFTWLNFRAVFINKEIIGAFRVTLAKCVVGTATSLFFTAMVAYAMTRPNLMFKKVYIPFIMFTMILNVCDEWID